MAVGKRLKRSFLDSSAVLTGSRWARAILSHIHTWCLNESNSFAESSLNTQTEGKSTVAHMLRIRLSFEHKLWAIWNRLTD